jgi:hypothetical protein
MAKLIRGTPGVNTQKPVDDVMRNARAGWNLSRPRAVYGSKEQVCSYARKSIEVKSRQTHVSAGHCDNTLTYCTTLNGARQNAIFCPVGSRTLT